ncbi:transketolase [Candidatus Curtissbacteria bacterium]|nr:transketolase [Candidatus Curtissbacteria bacterium]
MIDELHEEKLKDLEEKAVKARELVIETLVEAGSGHTAGPLGMTDIFVAFYFHILNHKPENPFWEERDRLVLSNGHICPIQYVTMAMAGYFPIAELKTLRKVNSRLQGHPHRSSLPGLETTSGPLGEGISQSIGMALAAKMDGKNHHIYCLTSDGEHQEGNTWEAMMMAPRYKLDNLCVVIDRNNIQIDGFTENVMPLEPLHDKYRAFNWHVIDVDGNNIHEFVDAVKQANSTHQQPTVIIAHTVPGKGVSFMENRFEWHGMPPDTSEVLGAPPKGEQAKKALLELKMIRETTKNQHK